MVDLILFQRFSFLLQSQRPSVDALWVHARWKLLGQVVLGLTADGILLFRLLFLPFQRGETLGVGQVIDSDGQEDIQEDVCVVGNWKLRKML